MKLTAYVLTLLLSSSISYAQAPDLGPDPVVLIEGEASPFAGILMTNERVSVLSRRAANAQKNTAAAVTKIVRLMQVDIDEAERKLQIEIELGEEKEQLWRDRLDAIEHWWERPIVVGPVAVALTVAAIWMARKTIIVVD